MAEQLHCENCRHARVCPGEVVDCKAGRWWRKRTLSEMALAYRKECVDYEEARDGDD